jgi:hypothetical protein
MSPASHVAPYGAPMEKVGSIGELIPGMSCKLVSTVTGQPVGINERGELWLKGPNVASQSRARTLLFPHTPSLLGRLTTLRVALCRS